MGAITVPAEWAAHRALWTCFPSAADLWEEDLGPAQAEVSAMIRALAAPGIGGRPGDAVKVLACGDEAVAAAHAAVGDVAEVIATDFGDIWLRDTGPIFAVEQGRPVALRFAFNGWGGKYELDHDDTVGDVVAGAAGAPVRRFAFALEGGAIEQDGEGTILTTRQCLLNPNRNTGWTEAVAEAALAEAFGARKVLWLDDGLLNDHTDGHIDNIARFVAPGVVACQSPSGRDDPNAAVLDAIARALAGMTDAAGRTLEVRRIPSPGLVTDEDGEPVPASHMNFIIGNAAVVVPIYGTASADEALRAIAALFPDRRTVGVSARAVLTGGGAFHCITQQEPA